MTYHLATIQLFITAITGVLAVVSWRFRFRPGARPFVGLTGVTTLLSATYLALIVAPDDAGLLFTIVTLRESVFPWVAVMWVVFALDYTGFGRFITRRTVAGLCLVPLGTLVVLWLPELRGLYWGSRVIEVSGLVQNSFQLGPWYWVNLGYGYVLMLTGFLLLVRLLVSDNQLYTDQSIAVLVGAVVPFVANFLLNLGVTVTQVPLQPLSFAITGLAFAYALYRFELFSVLPITLEIGRKSAIEDLDEGVLILDMNHHVVDANRAAADIFGAARAELVGQSIRELVDDRAPADADDVVPTEYRTDDGHVYGVTVSDIHARGDRLVGQTIVFRDVTDRELREAQLEVFNRVLRHNLGNKLTVVRGHAELLADRVDEEDVELVEQQMAATNDLLTNSVRAREFDELDARNDVTPTSVDVNALVSDLLADIRAEFPDATVKATLPPALVMETYPAVIEIMLTNLVENAARHAGPSPEIEVTVTTNDDEIEFVVRDDGPGIPDDELAVLEANTETALEHGTGMGLWITKWAVRYLSGSITFEDNSPTGTTAIVTAPRVATDGD